MQPDNVRAQALDTNFSQTKKLLLSLGLEQDFIDELSVESLQRYSTAPQITSTISYSKSAEDGTVTYVSEDYALSQTSSARSQTDNEIYDEEVTDSYMRMCLIVTYLGNAKYEISANARWLTMPIYRFTDSIGACGDGLSVDMSTCGGYVYYTTINNYAGTSSGAKYDLDEDTYELVANGTWEGAAVLLDLPADSNTTAQIEYQAYKVNFTFEVYRKYPTAVAYFNVSQTYDHMTLKPALTNNIGIALSGDTAEIGFSLAIGRERRTLPLSSPIYYTP